jgi:glycosyltransferase involved in cell wall biosynthesis
MQLSFIVPAYNEEGLLDACLQSIDYSVKHLRDSGEVINAEIIVVDNNSTDATAEIARRAGAIVVFEPVNQISRARNAGAKVASGDWLIFIDADSQLNRELLCEVIHGLKTNRYMGFGSIIAIDGLPFWGRMLAQFWSWLSTTFSWAAGAFVVCEKQAFRTLGGFSTELYAAEEVEFSQRINKLARKQGKSFKIFTSHPLQSSNRKLALYSGWEMFKQIARLSLRPRKSLRDKKALDVWYDGRR